jgi:hypothetical protein
MNGTDTNKNISTENGGQRIFTVPLNLKFMFKVATTGLVGVFITLYLKVNLLEIWEQGLGFQISTVIYLISLLLWFIPWLAFDFNESEVLDSMSTSRYKFFEKMLGIIIACIFCILFGLIASFIGNPGITILLMSIIVILASMGDSMIITGINRISLAQNGTSNSEIITYYLNRPHMALHCLQLFLLAIAGVIYSFIKNSSNSWLVYDILAFSIFLNEIVLWKWRIQRIRLESESK